MLYVNHEMLCQINLRLCSPKRLFANFNMVLPPPKQQVKRLRMRELVVTAVK